MLLMSLRWNNRIIKDVARVLEVRAIKHSLPSSPHSFRRSLFPPPPFNHAHKREEKEKEKRGALGNSRRLNI